MQRRTLSDLRGITYDQKHNGYRIAIRVDKTLRYDSIHEAVFAYRHARKALSDAWKRMHKKAFGDACERMQKAAVKEAAQKTLTLTAGASRKCSTNRQSAVSEIREMALPTIWHRTQTLAGTKPHEHGSAITDSAKV